MDRDSTASALPEAKRDAAPLSPPLRRTGEFSCSNHLLNILAERMIREQERIFSGPTAPGRETLLLLSEAAGFALDLRPLFLRELAEGGLAESYAGVVVLDQLYRKYGETEAVRQYLPAAAAHLESAEKETFWILSGRSFATSRFRRRRRKGRSFLWSLFCASSPMLSPARIGIS